MINYIFYTIVSLGSAYFVYHISLEKQKTFQFNRFFLLVTLLLCLLAPIMEFDILEPMPSITEISIEPSEGNFDSHEMMQGLTVAELQNPSDSIFNILWYIYLIISMCFAFRFLKNLFEIIKLTRQSSEQIGNLKLVETDDYKNPSSFFNYLFINSESLKNKEYSDPMIQHELVHCNQWHTLDVILVELLLCAFWFNPFVWLYRKAIVQNHEYIADFQTVQFGIDIENYSQIIINSSHVEDRVPLTSGFNFIQIKNRITMLHQSKSSVLKRTLKITMALLLFSGIFMFSSFKNLSKPLVVVVDVAHGGHDSGNLNEKDIVLSISNALVSLSNEKVKIMRTRNHDEFISLKERTKFINNKKPDLFLSLHCNAYQDKSLNGVEAYYDSKNEHNETSLAYAKVLVEHQMEHFSSRGVKSASFYLLKNTTVPGVFLELGFITNEDDRNILTDAAQQVNIAKSIYEGLMEIQTMNPRQ